MGGGGVHVVGAFGVVVRIVVRIVVNVVGSRARGGGASNLVLAIRGLAGRRDAASTTAEHCAGREAGQGHGNGIHNRGISQNPLNAFHARKLGNNARQDGPCPPAESPLRRERHGYTCDPALGAEDCGVLMRQRGIMVGLERNQCVVGCSCHMAAANTLDNLDVEFSLAYFFVFVLSLACVLPPVAFDWIEYLAYYGIMLWNCSPCGRADLNMSI